MHNYTTNIIILDDCGFTMSVNQWVPITNKWQLAIKQIQKKYL